MSIRSRVRFLVPLFACAVCFLAGGLVLPRVVSATVSSGERDAFFPLPPARILDTRTGPSPQPIGTPIGQGQALDLVVAGQGGVPATASAVVLNVTATEPTVPSYLTVFPTGGDKPTASNLNFTANQTIPNAVTVKLGAGGAVSIYNNSGSVHVIVDVSGYYEDQNFDDRYYTKAQTDANIATAITTPNHITGAQVANGSLSIVDLVTGAVSNIGIGMINVPANSCIVESIDLGNLRAGSLLIPYSIAAGIPNSALLSAYPVILNNSGQAALNICNRGLAAFNPGVNVLLAYHLA